MRNHEYFVYIVTNKNKTTLYIGVTNNLRRRLNEHSEGTGSAFTKRYNCYYLLYFECYSNVYDAIYREKQIKKYRREKKDKLISDFNPNWEFLNEMINKSV